MTGLVRKATLLGVCGLLAAATAMAAVPSPGNSTIVSYIKLVGTKSAPGNPAVDTVTGQFTITVRDFTNTPISGSNVEINFQNCSDSKVCTAVVAGQTVDCINAAVRATTNALGQVVMTILGAATNAGTTIPPAIAAGAGANCGRIFADGVQLGIFTAVDPDENGAAGGNGVNGADLGTLKNDVGAVSLGAAYKGRGDIDMNGLINGSDLGFLKDIVGRSSLGNGSATGCADGTGAKPYCL